MIETWRASFRDFRIIHRKVLVFESLFILLSGFVFVPFISWLFDRLLRFGGRSYLVNSEVLKYVFNIRGLLAFLIMGILMVFLLFVELGVIVVLSQKIYFGHRVSVMDALTTVIKRTPRIVGIGIIQFLLLMILVSPLIDSPLLNYLLGGFNLNIMFFNPIRQSILNIVLSAVIAVVVFMFSCRLIFALHLTIIRGLTLTKALTTSWRLTHGKVFRISAALLAGNVFIFGLAFLLIILLNYLPQWLGLTDRIMFLQSVALVFSSYTVFIITMLVIPLNIIIISRLYYSLSQNEGDALVLSGSWIVGKAEKRIGEAFSQHTFSVKIIVFLLLGLTFFLNTQIYSQLTHARWNIMIAAHRGDPVYAPENTIPAIEAAILQAVDYVEVDVQLTSDEILVLFHDSTLRRIDGTTRAVKDMTIDEIKHVDAGSWFSEDHFDERIPTLEEVIIHIGDRSKLLIDVKLTSEPEKTAEILAALIEAYDLTDHCLVQSFSPRFLAELRLRNPEIKIGQILTASAGRLEKMDVDFYTISQNMLTENFVEMARGQGRHIWVWTVNSERNIRTVLSYDINGIITDYPQRVKQIGGFADLLSEPDPVPQLASQSNSTESEQDINTASVQ